MLDKLVGFGGTIAANEQVGGCTSTICILICFPRQCPKTKCRHAGMECKLIEEATIQIQDTYLT